MKLVRYGAPGKEKPGLIDADGRVRALSAHVADIEPSILSPLELDKLRRLDPASLPLVAQGVRLGPPVAQVSKLIGVGLNYADHVAETGLPSPTEPLLFMKATTAISGPNDDIIMPLTGTKLDWEVELGVVIGSRARNVSRDVALDHVAGYCIVNDVSERAFQMERGGQFMKGKCADTFAPLGPWLVTSDEVGDPQALALFCEVNGQRFQDGSTKNMIFPIADVVAHVSEFMTLLPGDVLTTGTPAGVGLGMKPPRYLAPGDTVRLGITKLGEQNQTVAAYR